MLDVSVLIPVYNEEDKLRENVLVLHKYLKSKKLLFEIIICNDGSTDNSLHIANQIKEEINNVFIVGYPNNKGRGYALKYSEKYINGEFVPDFENYKYETWGQANTYGYTVSIWKCTKIGSDTPETIQKRNTNYYAKRDEYIRRELFWRNYIKPLSNTIRMPYNYYSYDFDLFKGERPKYIASDEEYVWDIITNKLNNSEWPY